MTSSSTIEFVLDQLSSLGNITTRKMFGEYALYYQAKVVALVCDDILFVKITPAGREFAGKYYQEGFPYPKAKPAIQVDGDRIEDDSWLCQLIQITYDNLPSKPVK